MGAGAGARARVRTTHRLDVKARTRDMPMKTSDGEMPPPSEATFTLPRNIRTISHVLARCHRQRAHWRHNYIGHDYIGHN